MECASAREESQQSDLGSLKIDHGRLSYEKITC